MVKTLISKWEEICNKYVKEFCKKHSYDSPEIFWIGNDPGTILCCNDMFIHMDDIRYDVDNNIPESYFEKWYWKRLDLYELGIEHWLNYSSYCKGAPDPYDEEKINEIKENQRNIDNLQKKLKELINNK